MQLLPSSISWIFQFPEVKFCPHQTLSPHPSSSPHLQPWTSSHVLSDSMNLTFLRVLYKWYQTVSVWTYYESESISCSVVSDSLWPWNSPGQNTGVGSLSLLQGIFPTQGSNPGLPHCRWILYQLSHRGNPRILEWVAFPFSKGSSPPRDPTGVSCIAGRFFTSWATGEAQGKQLLYTGIKF